MFEVYTTSKGRITIPSYIRRKLGITAGTRVQVVLDEREGKIILTPVTRARIQKLFGLYKDTDLLGALAEDKVREREK